MFFYITHCTSPLVCLPDDSRPSNAHALCLAIEPFIYNLDPSSDSLTPLSETVPKTTIPKSEPQIISTISIIYKIIYYKL